MCVCVCVCVYIYIYIQLDQHKANRSEFYDGCAYKEYKLNNKGYVLTGQFRNTIRQSDGHSGLRSTEVHVDCCC